MGTPRSWPSQRRVCTAALNYMNILALFECPRREQEKITTQQQRVLGRRGSFAFAILFLRSQVKSSTNTPVMQGAKQMYTERRCDCELPRQSCRLGRACVDFFDSGHALVLFGAPAQKEVRREVGFVMPESRSTRLIG